MIYEFFVLPLWGGGGASVPRCIAEKLLEGSIVWRIGRNLRKMGDWVDGVSWGLMG